MKLLQMSGYNVACSLALSQADRTLGSSRQNGSCDINDERQANRNLHHFIKKMAKKDGLGTVCNCVREKWCVCVSVCVSVTVSVSACLHLCALHTNEGSDLGVDDATGEEVKVVLHRVHHHRVSCVVAALQRGDKRAELRDKQRHREA